MTAADSIPYLSEAALADLGITTSDVIESIEAVILGSARATVRSAPKAIIVPEDGRYMMAAMAVDDDPALLAVKTLVLNPRNPDRGLPQINGLITLLDSDTGLPAAVLDANWITAIRTAGLSAVAAKRMARPGSAVAAFIGAGVQARSHLAAFADMFPLQEIKVFGRGSANIDRLCQAATALGKSAVVCASCADAVTGADLIVSSVTLTAAPDPIIDVAWLQPGCFAAITDLGVLWKKDSFAGFSRIVIDDAQQEAAMADKLVSPDLVAGDLTDLVLGRVTGRERDDERTAFVFRGHALGDLALSTLAYRKSGLAQRGAAASAAK
jgi:ornithine cyclodeaminase/alanine dehydrogenase